MRHLVPWLLLLAPVNALASPWTLPQGDSTVSVGFEFQLAMDEYLADGQAQSFPL